MSSTLLEVGVIGGLILAAAVKWGLRHGWRRITAPKGPALALSRARSPGHPALLPGLRDQPDDDSLIRQDDAHDRESRG